MENKCQKCSKDFHQWFTVYLMRQQTSDTITGSRIKEEDVKYCPCCGRKLGE